mmetsp:Transcript_29113/g.35467  ORF Transcript_29113/g.35467 Transcript_29113/m.35467 type:complete len:144 (+) Transcript_29113:48-479(+)|eukprot:CAMPEP_0172498588 /NCGR_PEP_ID=MMETSP1066-20121228/114055_1 /TAXON_ID=671091 /ORGANISM="Coscinodiscus wailesii, Strain CCMP2513" /LENGTH=143 /DNA_ID=CAMNT_0013271913 /DNA_START=48 /DNA_END=479 /DNA_ORIENTATION=+
MIQIIAILLAVIAVNVLGNQAAWPLDKVKMAHEVVGGEACYKYKMYDDSNCTGEPSEEGGFTRAASIADGCEDGYYDGTSISVYCGDTGVHVVYFNSSFDCSGDGEEYMYWAYGCIEFDNATSGFISCTLNGPCDEGGVESMA